jgi:hypothetical protein
MRCPSKHKIHLKLCNQSAADGDVIHSDHITNTKLVQVHAHHKTHVTLAGLLLQLQVASSAVYLPRQRHMQRITATASDRTSRTTRLGAVRRTTAPPSAYEAAALRRTT